MSPRIWAWRDDPWFKGLQRQKPYRRITRLKQYIMDHYAFNLDLDTWGLTTKERELARFRPFIDPDTLARSNALFGYEGDKYYFDIDIRTHFGLDKYEGNIIPYWKTETVEAMDAFRHKPGYESGAGECVSLATLYAAALFAVAGIPLEDIFLMATPLHSQNFVDVDDGILTNNRRLVTRNMWFNGTALSAQARRALENEQVTIVAHASGVIHTVYPEASIAPAAYGRFAEQLRAYLRTPLTREILGNFLRHDERIQRCFQLRWTLHGMDHYLPLERVFAYERNSPYLVTDHTRPKLMQDVDMEEFCEQRLPSRVVLNDMEAYVEANRINLADPQDAAQLKRQFSGDCLNADIALNTLIAFCHTEPRLPDAGQRRFVPYAEPLGLEADMGPAGIRERLAAIRGANPMADMAFYAWRDLSSTEPEPFLLAAVQRCPVAVEATGGLDLDQAAAAVQGLDEASIYDGPHRLAQPDEVWNFRRGDGAEKAVLLAAILRARRPDDALSIELEDGEAVLRGEGREHRFRTAKRLGPAQWEIPPREGPVERPPASGGEDRRGTV